MKSTCLVALLAIFAGVATAIPHLLLQAYGSGVSKSNLRRDIEPDCGGGCGQ